MIQPPNHHHHGILGPIVIIRFIIIIITIIIIIIITNLPIALGVIDHVHRNLVGGRGFIMSDGGGIGGSHDSKFTAAPSPW